jgi:hypothetical protein
VRLRIFGVVLGLVLLAAFSPSPATAAVSRKWGQVLDSYGAKLYACRVPQHTKHGTVWRTSVRVANHSRVRVRASVRVIRTMATTGRQRTQHTWARTVAAGGSTSVGLLPVYDTGASNRFHENVTYRLGRPYDALVLQWDSMVPTGVPRCDLPVKAIAWQGSGFPSDHGGRMQICSNLLLDGSGARLFWRFRGDATHADEVLHYNARVTSGNGHAAQTWSRTKSPGGYTPPGSLSQAVSPTGGDQLQYFLFGASPDDTTSTYGTAAFRNVC